jgi:hypothetical protein
VKLGNFVAIIGVTLFLNGCTSTPVAEADRTFERVVEAPGYSKDRIYSSTKIWIAENFKSAKSVIELDSKEDGIIIGNGVIQYPCSDMGCSLKSDWKVPFTMRVDIKDQKFKISFSNIRMFWPATYRSGIVSPAYDGPVTNQSSMNEIKPALLKFGDEILASMNSNRSKSNW